MATLSDIRTTVARKVRDTSNATWSTSELDDTINQGIDAIGSFYPKEIVSTFATIAAGTVTYAASSYTGIYRIDVYNGTSFMGTLPHSIGDGADSGWELHNGIVHLPPSYTITTGYTLKAFGYSGYVQLAASTSTTDLDTTGLNALYLFCQKELLWPLVADRAKFQQWQTDTNNTDTTSLAMAQIAGAAEARWQREQRRLRRIRKLG